MTIRSPFARAAIILVPAYLLNLYLFWDSDVSQLSAELQGRFAGRVLSLHLIAFLVTGLVAKFALKSAAWPKIFLIYIVSCALFWLLAAVGNQSAQANGQEGETAEQLERLGEDLEGGDAQAYGYLRNYAERMQGAGLEFHAAFEQAMEDWVLDYSRLSDDAEFEEQRRVLETYMREATRYQALYDSAAEDLQSQLRAMGPDNEFAVGALRGFVESKAENDPLMLPYLEGHAAYSRDLLDLLDLLEDNRQVWTWEDGSLLIDSDPVLEDYSVVVGRMTVHEKSINELAPRIAELRN